MTSKFDKLRRKIQEKGNYSPEQAAAITASIGRKKYGSKKFAEMAQKGKNKAKNKAKGKGTSKKNSSKSGKKQGKR